jgi:hypothetical protein
MRWPSVWEEDGNCATGGPMSCAIIWKESAEGRVAGTSFSSEGKTDKSCNLVQRFFRNQKDNFRLTTITDTDEY